MIDFGKEWNALFTAGGALLPLEEKVEAAVKQVFARVPGAREYVAESAGADMKEFFLTRLIRVFTGPLVKDLRDFMGSGEFMEHVFLANSVSPQLREYARRFGEKVALEGYGPMYARYPLMKVYEDRISENWIAAQAELLARFTAYRDVISARFFGGKDAGRILAYTNTQADPKQHGRIVTGVECEGGRFYYKPHDCRIDAFYRELAEKIFPDVTAAPDVIEGDGFGFCKELVPSPVAREADVARYFCNYGALAALYHALNGIDLHMGNVLACGMIPCVIDLENLLTPSIPDGQDSMKTRAEKAQDAAVTRIGLLPHRDYVSPGEKSALHRLEGQPSGNLPVTDGTARDVTGHEENFIEGFNDGYRRILSAKGFIRDSLAAHPGMTVRCLYNSAKLHAVLRDRLFLPESMATAEKQAEVLDRLKIGFETHGREVRESILDYEENSLLEGDTPYYCAGIFSRDLFGADTGEQLTENELERTPYESVCDKLDSLCEEERAMEEKLIRLTLAHRLSDDGREYAWPPEDWVSAGVDSAVPDAELEGLTDALLADGVTAPDGTLFWYSALQEYFRQPFCGQCTLQADIMILCSAILTASHHEKLREKAMSLLNRCIDAVAAKLDLWRNSEETPALPPGLNGGLGGVLLGCAAAEKAGIPQAAALCDGIVAWIEERQPWKPEKPGLGYGTAGLLYALCAVPARKDTAPEQKRLQAIARLGDSLAAYSFDGKTGPAGENDPFTGSAGIGAALAAAGKTLNSDQYVESAEKAFDAVCGRWNSKIGGWYGKNARSLLTKGNYAAGIGLCAAFAAEHMPKSASAARCLELALESEMGENALFRRDVLENGNALRVLFLLRAGQLFPDRGCVERAEQILAMMIARKNAAGDYIVSPEGLRNSFDPSFWTGSSGIGAAIAGIMQAGKTRTTGAENAV